MLSNLQQPELPQPTTGSSRRTRRCSICRMQGHDRRFHTIAERTVQENMINANRELRQQRLIIQLTYMPTTLKSFKNGILVKQKSGLGWIFRKIYS